MFQLLTQVAGRSGRDALQGEVMIQTYSKEQMLFKHASQEGYRAFFDKEIQTRKLFDFPPFTRLAKLTFSGKNEQQTLQTAQTFHDTLLRILPQIYHIYPVIPSGYAKIKDRFRFKFLIKGKNPLLLSHLIKKTCNTTPLHRNINLLIDMDPLSTFL